MGHKLGYAKKCYILSIRNKSQRMYTLDGHILQQVQNNPYLGLQISEDLKWTTHITNVAKKANSTLGFLRINLRFCPKECKKTAYISLARSTMEYGAIVWYQVDPAGTTWAESTRARNDLGRIDSGPERPETNSIGIRILQATSTN